MAIFILFLAQLILDVSYANELFYYVSIIIVLFAFFVSYYRDNKSYVIPFVVSISIYPIITPFISQDLLKFKYFSGYGIFMQEKAIIATPLLYASLLALYLSVSLNIESISRKKLIKKNISSSQIKGNIISKKYNKRPLFYLLIISSMMVCFFAWLTEPGGFIYNTSYADIIESRIKGAPFAGAAWAGFVALCLMIYVRISNSYSYSNYTMNIKIIFWLTIVLSVLYLIGHGRRVEASGFVFLLAIIFGTKIFGFQGRATKKKSRIFIYVAVIFTIFAFIGYARNSVGIDFLSESSYFSLPGGGGNVTIGYIAAWWLSEKEKISIFPGETYISHLIRLPPAFLGFERPPLTYDYIEKHVKLIGGEYFLNEPMINFGITGMFFYVFLFAYFFNKSIIAIKNYCVGNGNAVAFMMSAMFIILIFRTMWYGLGSLIKGEIIAVMIGLFATYYYQIFRIKQHFFLSDLLASGSKTHSVKKA